MPNPRRILLFALLLIVAACTSGGGGGRMPRRDVNRITEEEVQQAYWTNAFEIIQNLRPTWLRRRAGLGAQNVVQVYLDETQMGGPNALRQVEKQLIREIRYIDPNTATNRWGIGHSAGAVQVITRR